MTTTIRAEIREEGNGLAVAGDYVACARDGQVYRVVRLIGRPQTGRRPGMGMWILADIELADWDDISDDNEPVCNAVLEDAS